MRFLILGGDGFCGWPTALHLSLYGHDVVIVDNFSRRGIDRELGTESLTPIREMSERVDAWREVTGNTIKFMPMDVSKESLTLLIESCKPDAIVHFAEQRSAPYSMKSAAHKRYTVDNNVNATNNVLASIVESGRDVHLIHLGTMGVYGYGTAGMEIPEGYLPVTFDNNERREILYPTDPGSVYHVTKCQDQEAFKFYAKNDGLRITDLHQGIVWGTQTQETAFDERLINRFDYDGDYGTVLNRFLMQAAVGHKLTVHGTGGQTRAFIHISDMVECIRLSAENPPERGERPQIRNQATETHRVRDLAVLVAEKTGTEIAYLENPRNEAQENELNVCNDSLLGMGLEPTTLDDGLMGEVRDVAYKYKDRCDTSKILCRTRWT